MAHNFPAVFPELETDRLLLLETRQQDAEALFAVLSQESIARFYDIVPFTSIDQAHELVERRKKAFEAGERIRWAITRKNDSRLMGSCGYVNLNNKANWAEIGYELGEEYQGHGYMTEALKAMLEYGFSGLDLHRIEAQVAPKNTASINVLERLGFQREGILRERFYCRNEFHDLIMYSLLRDEHRENNSGDNNGAI